MKLPAFYPLLDTAILARRDFEIAAAAEAILEAGARILQFRHKAFFSREVFDQAARVRDLCRAANAQFVLNDRADFAMLLGSALHLGQDDLAPADARAILPSGAIIGFSTHNAEQLAAGDREPVDYLAIGPIFGTASKDNPDPVVGVEKLGALRGLTSKPMVAIGGIALDRAQSVLAAGADSLAIIGDLYPDPLTKASLRSRAAEWMATCSSRS